MQRRTFILFSLLSSYSLTFAKENESELEVLKVIFDHIFPTTKKYNGAKKFGAFEYLIINSKHKSFDKSDMRFILDGMKEVLKLDANFIKSSKMKKEKTLRKFEQTRFGENVLSTLMYYGFEAMLSDPIYGGNKNMSGWKNIKHTPPTPMARRKYGK